MKKGLAACGIIAAVGIGLLVIIGLFIGGTYNSLVSAREDVSNKWAQVENQYQRRADLIPNLVSTVQGFADQEDDIFKEVTRLRSQWGAAQQSGNTEDQIEAARALDGGISRLLLVAENYPELKSNENFLELQSQLEGTENRVAVERMRYNDAVTDYNKGIKTFPRNIIASLFAFTEEQYFEADAGAENAPTVEFN